MCDSASRKRRHDSTLENKTVKAIFKKDDLDDTISASESDLFIDDCPKSRRRGRVCNAEKGVLNLVCEWQNCSRTFSSTGNVVTFNNHVKTHIQKDEELEKIEEDSYFCMWNECNFSANSYFLINQHLCYHAYITKLEAEGKNVEKRSNLPVCNHSRKVVIPILLNGYLCEWENCFKTFETVFDFFDHMKLHIFHNPKGKKEGVINCCWKGCTKGKFGCQYKLGVHLRMHTGERVVACPTCSTLFANVTKFSDHRTRQIPIEEQSYMCSQCSKYFPSERLLKEHMRLHINHYKCTMCDMTCSKPYLLAKHIRYRHLKERPYKCNQCPQTFVADFSLKEHLNIHKKENPFKCEECDFECRSSYGLQRHSYNEHGKEWPTIYECHMCQKRFHRGNNLTIHLKKVHNCQWPSGHSRFRYKEDPDGIFRLQTVRYETIDVIEEIMKGSSAKQQPVDNSIEYNVLKRISQDENAVQQFEVVVSQRDEDTSAKQVVITIDDLDSRGNVLKSETIQATEIICDNGKS